MIARFHDAGIEVILDVVYNHTAEGNELGPTLSFKGIDNASYYRLNPENPRYYINDTGTGNTLNLSNARVIQMVADSLRYWHQETQVDGFRFDLGTILAREPDGFDSQSGFLKVCSQDPVLQSVKRIAEPWDCGPGGYQVGEFPPGWAEWNDKFRDTVRDFWRGESSVGEFVKRLCASAKNTTRQTARTIRMERRIIARGIAARRVRPTIPRSIHYAKSGSEVFWLRCCWRKAFPCCWPATNFGAPSKETIMRIARTTN
jgi:isoamylase